MTIARIQYDAVGARVYTPEGPYGSMGNPPFQSYRPGEVARGDSEGEFVFVLLTVLTPTIMNQGDMLIWDTAFRATPAVSGAGAFGVGMLMGTLFLGGTVGEELLSSPPSPPPNAFQVNFTAAGVYGVWAQRTGATLLKAAATATAGKVLTTTAVPGQIDTPASPAAGTYTTPLGAGSIMPSSVTFTGNTTTGSTLITNASSNFGLVIGEAISGAGIPAGAYIRDLNGPVVTISAAATATAAGVTLTAAQRTTVGNTTTTSNLITGVPNIAGIFPNQTITGAGIPAATTILAINGTQGGGYTLTISANATATATAVALTTAGYVEAYMNEAAIALAN